MIAGLLLAWLLGVCGVACGWPRARTLRSDLGLILPLGALLGCFLTSAIFFCATLLTQKPAWYSAGVEVAILGLLLARLRTRWRDETRTVAATPTWSEWVLAFVLVQVVVVAAVISWRSFQSEPLGGWDGWAIWNMHARFMLRAGPRWPELLSASQLNWTHPDYPRLVPASVARLWAWAGSEDPRAAGLVSVLFAGATVMLLVATLNRARGLTLALIGGIVLLATPFFVTFAANEHADIPLGCFMLATIALILPSTDEGRDRGRWALAGIYAGAAAWTKNEGLLFVLIVTGLAGFHLWRNNAKKAAKAFFTSLAVALVPLLYFKVRWAPASDLIGASGASWLAQFSDGRRHALIIGSLWRDLGGFGEWHVAPWIALALPFVACRWRHILRAETWLVAAVIGLMMAGYYVVYLASPQDLAWHLDTSLVRLLLQLWPLTILAWGLAVPEAVSRVSSPATLQPRWMRLGFVSVTVIAATAVLWALSLQRGANEIAVRRVGLAEISVALGEGWFPMERFGRDEWSWSSGRAKVLVNFSGDSARNVTLRFTIGSAGSRTVAIRDGQHELWRGAVPNQRVPVVLANLALPPGTTTLEFSTDTPGVNEASAAGGRTLAFALYNLRVD